MAKKETNKKKPEQIIKYVPMPVQIYRRRNDLSHYKNAVVAAENFLCPQRYELYQIYINAVNDNHLSAVIQQRKNLTLGKKFNVVGPDGKINEEKTKLLRKRWFRDFLDLALESQYWGHSLVQFGPLKKDEFEYVELVPRQFVKPEKAIVVKSWGDNNGQSYLTDGYEDWLIGVGKPKDLGLLLKASPLIIWKTSAFGAWAEYQDKFGTPFRYVKTNVRDAQTKKNAEDMMNEWGISPWAVFDTDDVVEFLETTKQDAFEVFDAMINRVNSEIAKLILNQTGTTDEKSFVGSAEVQERILEAVGESDEYFIDGVNNYQLVPLMAKHGLLDENDRIEAEEADKLTILDHSKIDIEFVKTGKYILPPEYIFEKYGTEVIPVKEENEEDPDVEKLSNELDIYYK
jgi:hypothetical protein